MYAYVFYIKAHFDNVRIYVKGPDFKMALVCFILLCISIPIVLWKDNKVSVYIGKCLLCGNYRHMTAISECKMAATVLDMQCSMIDSCRLITLSIVIAKVVISPFRSDGSHIQFHDDSCIGGPCQCH